MLPSPGVELWDAISHTNSSTSDQQSRYKTRNDEQGNRRADHPRKEKVVPRQDPETCDCHQGCGTPLGQRPDREGGSQRLAVGQVGRPCAAQKEGPEEKGEGCETENASGAPQTVKGQSSALTRLARRRLAVERSPWSDPGGAGEADSTLTPNFPPSIRQPTIPPKIPAKNRRRGCATGRPKA